MGTLELVPRVCGKGGPYPCTNTVLRYDYDQLESGETIPVVSCPICGWVWMPPPRCPEPSRDEPPHKPRGPERKAVRLQLRGAQKTNYKSGRGGTCRNCGREMYMIADHLCRFCWNRRLTPESLEEAREIVQEWLSEGIVKMSRRGSMDAEVR